jgi:hypothetical protein
LESDDEPKFNRDDVLEMSARCPDLTAAEIGRALGYTSESAFRCTRRVIYGRIKDKAEKQGFEVQPMPPKRPVQELVEERKIKFRYKKAEEEYRHLVHVKIKMNGVIGICHLGDLHLDDDGTDIGRIEHDLDIIFKTDGMFSATPGDNRNNWTGRLGRLYGDQSTSAKEAIELLEWFLAQSNPLYIVGGNHDCWSGDNDPMRWIATQGGNFGPSEVRLSLDFPNGRSVIVNARHSWPGRSIHNPAHGPMRAAQMGWRDHILTCGHLHKSGYGVVICPSSGRISHCIQIASYKIYDNFAKEKGFPNQNIAPYAVTIIDPDAQTEAGLVKVDFCLESAADYLRWARAR